MAAETVENEVIELLKTDSKGWTVALFEDQIKITTCLCAGCNHICCDAVELACDHDDDADIYPHCKNCLNNLIEDNNNKCPINSHYDPVVIPIRSIRRQVSKSKVYCPYSIQYKLQQAQNKNNNAQIVDTIGGDQKEGGIALQNYESKQDENACKWRGTLNELIKIHMPECAQKYDPLFMKSIALKKLQDENKNLREIINSKEANIVQLQQEIESLKRKMNTQSEQNKQLQNEAMKLFHKLDKQDNDISSKVNNLQRQISSTEQQMQQLKIENEKLRDKNKTLQTVIDDKEMECKKHHDTQYNGSDPLERIDKSFIKRINDRENCILDSECPICLYIFMDGVMLPNCGHLICKQHLYDLDEKCPECVVAFKINDVISFSTIIQSPLIDEKHKKSLLANDDNIFAEKTRFEKALLNDEITKMRNERNNDEKLSNDQDKPKAKEIILTFNTKPLDIHLTMETQDGFNACAAANKKNDKLKLKYGAQLYKINETKTTNLSYESIIDILMKTKPPITLKFHERDDLCVQWTKALKLKDASNIQYKNNNISEAIKTLSEAISLHSTNKIFYSNRVLMALKTKDLDLAQSDCIIIRKLDPKSVYSKGHYLRGLVLMQMKQYKNAADAFITVLKLDSSMLKAQERLNECLKIMRGEI